MSLPAEAWLLVPLVAVLGIAFLLRTLAAAIAHGVAVVRLEQRVHDLHAHQRRQLIERGLVEATEEELVALGLANPQDAPQAPPTAPPQAGEAGRSDPVQQRAA